MFYYFGQQLFSEHFVFVFILLTFKEYFFSMFFVYFDFFFTSKSFYFALFDILSIYLSFVAKL